jgi:hypothetical protein
MFMSFFDVLYSLKALIFLDNKKAGAPVSSQPKQVVSVIATRFPEDVKCPHCNKQVTSRIDHKIGLGVGVISLGKFELIN